MFPDHGNISIDGATTEFRTIWNYHIQYVELWNYVSSKCYSGSCQMNALFESKHFWDFYGRNIRIKDLPYYIFNNCQLTTSLTWYYSLSFLSFEWRKTCKKIKPYRWVNNGIRIILSWTPETGLLSLSLSLCLSLSLSRCRSCSL